MMHHLLKSEDRVRLLSLLNRLRECNPEAVAIADDEFAHAVERDMQVFNDLGFAIEVEAQPVYIIHMDVEIEFAAGI